MSLREHDIRMQENAADYEEYRNNTVRILEHLEANTEKTDVLAKVAIAWAILAHATAVRKL